MNAFIAVRLFLLPRETYDVENMIAFYCIFQSLGLIVTILVYAVLYELRNHLYRLQNRNTY